MGLTGSGLNRFRAKVEKTLEDFFPVNLRYGARSIEGYGTGARTAADYIEGGKNETYRLAFRFEKQQCGNWIPAKGDSVDWIISPTQTMQMEILETSVRPQESRYHIVCRNRRS